MTDVKISQLPAATVPLSGTELVPIVQNNVTVQATVNDVASRNFLFDVAWFGAVGDGVTDDTAAIQAAIDAATVEGGTINFHSGLTYITRALSPKSDVALQLNGATLKLRDNSSTLLFSAISGGSNFQLYNGFIDGNAVNNQGNINLSGGLAFTGWNHVTIEDITFQSVYRAVLIFSNTTNITLTNLEFNNCGLANAFGRYSYGLELYSGCEQINISNFRVYNMYGFGIHFFGCTDFSADNLLFDGMTFTTSIAITFTLAKRGCVSNVYCNAVLGDNIEVNASTDIEIMNVNTDNAGNRPLLFGDNSTGIINQRVNVSNFKSINTIGSFAAALNFLKYCTFQYLDLDKTISTIVTGLPASDRNNVFSDCVFNTNISAIFTFYRKFHLKRVRFNDFYVNDHDGVISTFSCPQTSGSFAITVPNGDVTYINLNSFNSLTSVGFVPGRLRVTSAFNNSQGSYQECLFLASNNNTTLNLSAVTTVNNAVARAVTITADAANRRIVLTNSSGVALTVYWTVEMHKADQ